MGPCAEAGRWSAPPTFGRCKAYKAPPQARAISRTMLRPRPVPASWSTVSVTAPLLMTATLLEPAAVSEPAAVYRVLDQRVYAGAQPLRRSQGITRAGFEHPAAIRDHPPALDGLGQNAVDVDDLAGGFVL